MPAPRHHQHDELRTVEYGGVTLEAAGPYGSVYLTIDGKESATVFPTTAHAIDAGKRKVLVRQRRERRTTRTSIAMVEGHAFGTCDDTDCQQRVCRGWWEMQRRVFGRTFPSDYDPEVDVTPLLDTDRVEVSA